MKYILLICLVTLMLIVSPPALFAQQNTQEIDTLQKYALVIGNGAYANISRLNNPVNDANDITDVLSGLGFTVDTVLDGSLDQMESAIIRLKNRLSVSGNAYGFIFYAGHGVQFNGENYLIPVDANIQSESFLRQRTVSVSSMLDELNYAGNKLNIVVLDACRDNPFSWNRSASRGLATVTNQPADSIIMYSTAPGSIASDGIGHNGLFTGYLLEHLKTPDLEVTEVFRRTMGDVSRASDNTQRPWLHTGFPGTAYLGTRPAAAEQTTSSEAGALSAFQAKDYLDQGISFFDKGNYDLAIRAFGEAIMLDPRYSPAYSYRARAYNVKGDYERALSDANEAIFIDSNNAMGFFARAHVYIEKEDYDRAIMDYTQAIRLDPNNADIYNNRGFAYEQKLDYVRAKEDYETALRIDPNHARARTNLQGLR